MEIKKIDLIILKQYKETIYNYLKDVLDTNRIQNSEEELKKIYDNMCKYIKDNSAIIIGAFKKEELSGFIWAYKRFLGNEERLHIDYLVVNKQYRKQGIAQKLINEIYKEAKNNGIKKVELVVTATNESAMRFYQKQSFIVERINLCKEI